VPEVHHPLVVSHPITGQRALYGISGTAAGIIGLADDEAIGLLIGLKRHALRPEFRQQATAATGSILIWDNFAVMHCATRTEYSDEPGKRRELFRISTRATQTPQSGARQ
jgi:taurine dioxygenase